MNSELLSGLPLQRAWVEIDRGAIAHNVRQIRRLLKPSTDLMAVVKADAYGHGAVTVAQAAVEAGATWLGVATVTEGIELRRAGMTAPILLMGATHSGDEARAIAHWQIQPTLSSAKQAAVFSEALGRCASPLPVHLKLDTGMSRLGVPWEQAVSFVDWVQGLPNLAIASVYSHLATADERDPTVMRLQQRRYEEAIAALRSAGFNPPRLHLANSAATLADPALQYDMVRVGLGLYGLYPAPHLAQRADLQPVLGIQARITQVRQVAAGTGISYGHRFIAPQAMKVAVAGIGYADGVPRCLSNRLEVLIRGQRVRQLGNITMDQIMLDVSEIGEIQPGDRLTLLGQSGDDRISADDWAALAGTISWEILCGFKHRLPRVILSRAETIAESPRAEVLVNPRPRLSSGSQGI